MSTIGDVSTIPAGWYPDPESNARSRWWDGTGWTASVSEPQPPAPPQEPFVPQHAAPIPQAHFEQRPFVPAPVAPPFMPQQAELQRFVTQPGALAPAPSGGTMTRRQLRELTSASETSSSDAVAVEPAPVAAAPAEPAPVAVAPVAVAPVVEPARPAHAPAHAAAPIVVPSAAPGTPFGDVAVMPSYGTPITPPAASAAPAASNQVSTYTPPAAAPAANPYSGLASPSLLPQEPEAVAPAAPLAAASAPANPFAAAAPPANPFAAASASTNPFAAAAPAAFVAPANPFATPADVAPANPFAAPASTPFPANPFGSANPFATPTASPEFSMTPATPAYSFNFEPVTATERSGSSDERVPVQTGGIWFFALVPLIQVGLMYLVYVTLAMAPSLPTLLGLLVAPPLFYLLAAEKDRKKLDSVGHDRLTATGWALLPLVFMIIRTVRVGARGVPALVVWIVASLASTYLLNLLVRPAIEAMSL